MSDDVFFDGEQKELIATVKELIVKHHVSTDQIIKLLRSCGVLADNGVDIGELASYIPIPATYIVMGRSNTPAKWIPYEGDDNE